MFNRTVIVPHTEHVTHEVTKHIHHHRAPTDDSVRLLKELEEKAQAKIIEAVHVGDTTFDCVVHFQRTMIDDNVCLLAVFSLNGKKITVEHKERQDRYDRREAFLALRDAMAKEIAGQVLAPAVERLLAQNTKFGLLGA